MALLALAVCIGMPALAFPTLASAQTKAVVPDETLRAASSAPRSHAWVAALQNRIAQCWRVPNGHRPEQDQNPEVRVYLELGLDGTLLGEPQVLKQPSTPIGPLLAESVIRALRDCQPYNFLPSVEYKGGWDKIDMTFSMKVP